MDLLLMLIVALGLSMDAFAVSIATSLSVKKISKFQTFSMPFAFGFFQMSMPILGYYLGTHLHDIISSFDHWIAAILLFYIGGKMVYESRVGNCEMRTNPFALKNLIILSIATSIDALCVGLSFALLDTPILVPALIIGLITFGLCAVALQFGRKLGCIFSKRAELAGGAILMVIGFKVLIEHLL